MTNANFVPVIKSLLENDLYKFTMWQALFHSHPAAHAEYEFTCRNKPEYPLSELAQELNAQLDHLCALRFDEGELDYMRSLRYIKPDFVDFLSLFHLQRKFITVSTDGEHLRVRAIGPMVHTLPFEIYVLQLVNELYFRRFDKAPRIEEGTRRLHQKIDIIRARAREIATNRPHPFEFFDFGLRRRFSAEMQELVVKTLAAEVPEHFKGTSNVHLARKYNLVPIGTHAHEWFGLFQAQETVRLRN
jgi:nicotinate phosphoribosyltransferase